MMSCRLMPAHRMATQREGREDNDPDETDSTPQTSYELVKETVISPVAPWRIRVVRLTADVGANATGMILASARCEAKLAYTVEFGGLGESAKFVVGSFVRTGAVGSVTGCPAHTNGDAVDEDADHRGDYGQNCRVRWYLKDESVNATMTAYCVANARVEYHLEQRVRRGHFSK